MKGRDFVRRYLFTTHLQRSVWFCEKRP